MLLREEQKKERKVSDGGGKRVGKQMPGKWHEGDIVLGVKWPW